MKDNVVYENASQRKTYVGHVFDLGEHIKKKEILESIPEEWSRLHREGYIHIHDLDAYGLAYNCLTFNILNKFPYKDFENLSDFKKIIRLFDYLENLISKVGNEQSGGMGFANFDNDLSTIICQLGVVINDTTSELLKDSIGEFIAWCNGSHERMGQVSYYVTLNIGLAKDDLARFICGSVIDEFASSSSMVFKPNIVFKVKKGINYCEKDPNYDLFEKALDCTTRKMIPTYIICDSETNAGVDPELLSIMGCRTRVVNDIYGCTGSLGRGNICNISINLPRIALESSSSEDGFQKFKEGWLKIAETTTQILLDRYHKTTSLDSSDFPTVSKYELWIKNFSENTTEEIFKHGTLSIGFIGLSEALEIITGKRFYEDDETYRKAIEFVEFMRKYTESCIEKYKLNFSLLATSGELISGRFCEIDSEQYSHKVLEKGFYTNSFHINVDSNIPALDKISKEGVFHKLCNGGCISYIELGEAPIGNVEALKEVIDCAISSGTHYLGINFPKDICKQCGEEGVFDVCPKCGCDSIIRIRRVSGYLEILDYFVKGKKAEVANRRSN